KCWVVVDHLSIGGHRRNTRRDQLEPKTKRGKERLLEQKLDASTKKFKFNAISGLHDTTWFPLVGKPMYAAMRCMMSAAAFAVSVRRASDSFSSSVSTTSERRTLSAMRSSSTSPQRFSRGKTSTISTMLPTMDLYNFGLLPSSAELYSAMRVDMWETTSYKRCQRSRVPARKAACTESAICRFRRSRSESLMATRKSLASGSGFTLILKENLSRSSCGYRNRS